MSAQLHRLLPGMLSRKERICMKKFVCTVCGFVYEGEELPEDYECPLCSVGPDQFEEEAE